MFTDDQPHVRQTRGVIAAAALTFCLLALVSILKWQAVDIRIVHFINRGSQRSFVLDHLFGNLSRLMFSNLLIVSLLWAAWFESSHLRSRAVLLMGTFAASVASVVSRCLQLVLPSHARPLHDAALGFRVPLAVNPNALNHWSSFPSDHAALFFGVAMAIFLVSRRLGLWALGIAVVINFARIYLGFHYPSDVVGGAALGILLAALSYPLSFRPSVLRVTALSERHSALFYGVAFYASFALVTLLQDYRDIASGLVHHLHHHAR